VKSVTGLAISKPPYSTELKVLSEAILLRRKERSQQIVYCVLTHLAGNEKPAPLLPKFTQEIKAPAPLAMSRIHHYTGCKYASNAISRQNTPCQARGQRLHNISNLKDIGIPTEHFVDERKRHPRPPRSGQTDPTKYIAPHPVLLHSRSAKVRHRAACPADTP
jgi:hypothetical protein